MPISDPVPGTPARTSAPAAPLTLVVLSPLIGEVLFGAVPLSLLPFGLLGLVGLYGGGAVLVRELVRRRRLPGVWLVILGVAYGIFEEGTVTQSLFDQHYRGLSFLGFYGHWLGVNWVWALFIVPYHAVFSIAIPIRLVELAYPDRAEERWLTPLGITIALAAFGANAGLLALFHTGLFTAHEPVVSVPANVVALLAALALVATSVRAAPRTRTDHAGIDRIASPRRLRLLGLASGLAWFIGYRVLIIGNGTNVSAPAALGLGALIAGTIAWRILHWSEAGRPWTPESTYALIAGALPASWLLGFLIAAVSGGNPVVNLVGQALFGIVMFVALRRLHLRLAPRACVK